jgi:hypothetical protein
VANLPSSKVLICKTVIDYAACSHNLFSSIKTFSVADRVPGYDHAQLLISLEVHIDTQTTVIPNPRKRRKVEITLPDNMCLEKLLIQTLAAGKDEQGKVRAL